MLHDWLSDEVSRMSYWGIKVTGYTVEERVRFDSALAELGF